MRISDRIHTFALELASGQATDRESAGGICVGVTPGPDPDQLAEALAVSLHPEERRFADSLHPNRRPTWIAGRIALRAALARAGVPADAPILADDRGAPVVPAGAVGSISHKQTLAIAAAAPDRGWTLGVDVEVFTREVFASRTYDIASRVLTDRELAELDAPDAFARGTPAGTPAAVLRGDPDARDNSGELAAERARRVLLRFSLKEAVYKAIDPFVRRYVGFREVSVWPAADPAGDGGAARVEPLLRPGDPALAIEARWVVRDGFVISAARARFRRGGA